MRSNSVRAETLASVLVGFAIIAIVSAGMVKMLAYHATIEEDHARNQTLRILQNNVTNVLRKIDTSGIAEKETFSVYKDRSARRFTVMTGAQVEPYRYVDRSGDWVSNTGTYQGTVYTRTILLDRNDSAPVVRQVFKAEIRELVRK